MSFTKDILNMDDMFRVDPEETSDEGRSPLKLAAEQNNDDILEMLREAIGGDIPDDVKILQLSKAMQEGDSEKFSEILSSLSPELVRSKIANIRVFVPFGQIWISPIGEHHWN